MKEAKTSKLLKILTWNVNGFRALLKKKNIIDNEESPNNTFINFIEKNDPDMICLSEIKMSCESDQVLYDILPDYPYKYTNHCTRAKGRHGVAVISKYKPINVVDTLIDNPKGQGRYLQLEFKSFFLVNVYVPNSGRTFQELEFRTTEWDVALIDRLNELKETGKEIILTGDLNVVERETDTYNFVKQRNKVAGVHDEERLNFQELLNNGYINAFREVHPKKIEYTHFHYLFKARENNKGMLLDYFIITPKLVKRIVDVKILSDIFGSDHVPIQLVLRC